MNFELDQETKKKIARLGKCKEKIPEEELNGKYKKAFTQLKKETGEEIAKSLGDQCSFYLEFTRYPSKEELNVIQRITDVYQEKIREAAFRKYDANSVEKLGGLLFSTLATKASGLIVQRQIHM